MVCDGMTIMSMAWHKVAVIPLLRHLGYCSLAGSHLREVFEMTILCVQVIAQAHTKNGPRCKYRINGPLCNIIVYKHRTRNENRVRKQSLS